MPAPLFLNKWAKGSSENANLGNGVFVGVETYSNKGIAQLTKDTTKVSGSVVTDLPISIAIVVPGIAYVQGDSGKVYSVTSSSNPYDTWTDITNGGSSGVGKGIYLFQGYLFAWRGTIIEYYHSGSWSAFKTGLIEDIACPMLFPGDGFVYFSNGYRVGKLGFGTSATFNPAGTIATDYFYDANWQGTSQGGILTSFYNIISMTFYGSGYIALGTSSPYDANVSDLILWNPNLSTHELPLRLYSQSQVGQSGIHQLINRNNVLYAVVGGSQSVFSTNGQSFNIIADISLSSNIRKVTGMQAQVPVFMNPYTNAIDIFGNKILTGVSTPNSISSYPSGYGLFPCGVWTIAMESSSNAVSFQPNSTQCEYTISTGTVVAVNKQFRIGLLKCVGNNQTLIGWQDGTSYGVDIVSTSNYQNDISTVLIESEMMEIGTPLDPETIQTIQLNTPRTLKAGQEVKINYRTGFDKDFALIENADWTFANNNDNGYKSTNNPIGATRFLQLQIQMVTTQDLTYSPELRNIIISP